MKLSEWARRNGVTCKTAGRWFNTGILPVKATRLPTGTLLVLPAVEEVPKDAALYARVSSPDQKRDLERQKGRLVTFATQEGMRVGKVVEEVGWGLDGHCAKLIAILRDPNIGDVVVEHRDRLARFGAEYIPAALEASGRHLIVMERGEREHDSPRVPECRERILGAWAYRDRGDRPRKARETNRVRFEQVPVAYPRPPCPVCGHAERGNGKGRGSVAGSVASLATRTGRPRRTS